jgi:hypothetical protein
MSGSICGAVIISSKQGGFSCKDKDDGQVQEIREQANKQTSKSILIYLQGRNHDKEHWRQVRPIYPNKHLSRGCLGSAQVAGVGAAGCQVVVEGEGEGASTGYLWVGWGGVGWGV